MSELLIFPVFHSRNLRGRKLNRITCDTVHVLQVTTKVTALSKSFLAEGALERPEPCMLPEVIAQVAALFEDTPTVRIAALKVQFDSLCLRVLHPNGLMPLLRDALEGFMFGSS